MDLTRDIQELAGLAATHELYARGWSKYDLGQAVAEGTVIRIRQGWYANPGLQSALAEAARVGGRVTCTTAAQALGLWGRPSPTLHVSVQTNASRLRSPLDKTKRLGDTPDAAIVVHWTARDEASDRYVCTIRQILRDLAFCQSPELVVATVDTAIRERWLSRNEWLEEISTLPQRLRRLLARADGKCDSWLESIVRFRLEMLGLIPQSQVSIRGVGRVDLRLGSKLLIELDGWEFHNNREAFELDRRRDARLTALGYRVLRFTHRQVTREWAWVRATIESCIASGFAV